MTSLIPAEYWEYSITDFITGLFASNLMNTYPESLPIPGIGNCIPVRSGRVALMLALQALPLPPGARIGVPLYCCPVVFKAIEAANCTHCFVDIDPTTACISPSDVDRKRHEIDALIAVHMFGNTCDMDALRQAVQGKPIIEDCAQSIGSKINGRLTGTFGDISFFSFRSGKYISVGEGGALFTKDQRLRTKLEQLVRDLPTPNCKEEIKHPLVTYIRSKLRSKPLYGLIGHRLWAFYNKKIDPAAKAPITISQIFKSDQALTIKRLSMVPSAIDRQRANADFYSKHLHTSKDMLFAEKPGTFYNRYLYPFKLKSMTARDSIAKFLYDHRIDAIQPYRDIVDYAAKQYGYREGCPVSEQTAKTILAIPTHCHLTDKDRNHIVRSFNDGLEALGKG